MPDRYPIALDWLDQECRPIACTAGTKHAAHGWERFQREDPTRVDLHRWWTGKRQNNENIALVLGPKPGGNVLFLNINVKNGHDGPATLKRLGWILPPTPTIATPSGGLAYAFKVPDPDLYPFAFDTHVHPRGYDGLEFRGAGGYQVVPNSGTTEGVYTFVPPWTLAHFRADLADLPGAMMQAWVKLDRGAKNSRTFGPENIGNARKRPSLAARTTDLSHPQPEHPNRSHVRAAAPPYKPRDLSSGAPVLLETDPTIKSLNPRAIRRLFGDWDANAAAAQFLGLGRAPAKLLCWNHPDTTPSMSLYVEQRTGAWKLHDWHDDAHYALADIFARHIIGYTVRLKGAPTLATWWKRLLLACKYLEQPDVPRMPLPQDARQSVVQLYEGFLLNVACHWLTEPGCAVPFTQAFAMAWCGMKSKHLVEYGLYRLRHDGQMRPAGRQHGSQVFLPGKE